MAKSNLERATRIAILALSPWHVAGMFASFSFAARRLQAALLSDPRLEGVEVRLFEHGSVPLATWIEELEDFAPHIVAASGYVWSMPTFVLLAREIKRRNSDTMVVLGGPSARPEMMALDPFRRFERHIDVLVLGEGERAICDLVDAYPNTRPELPGLALPGAQGWRRTAERTAPLDIDTLASPHRMHLSPRNSTAYLETFRGCPMSCSFCQWGVMDPVEGVMSVESLVREFEALVDLDPLGVCLVDAGLNLNNRSFRNLMDAEARTGFFRDRYLDVEIYPSKLKPEHLEFLGNARSNVGLGLQTANAASLARVGRPFDRDRFAGLVEDLAGVSNVSVEIILGLPGDGPAGFRETVEFLQDLPCNVRIYYCLVLPDAFMTRERDDVCFHPISLELESGPGWSRDALQEMCAWLDENAMPRSRRRQDFDRDVRLESYVEDLVDPAWWLIGYEDGNEGSRPASPHAPAGEVARVAETERSEEIFVSAPEPSEPVRESVPKPSSSEEIFVPDPGRPIPPALRDRIAKAIALATRGRWVMEDARRFDDERVITLRTRRGLLTLSASRGRSPSFRNAGGLGFSYVSEENHQLMPAEDHMLELVVELLGRLLEADA